MIPLARAFNEAGVKTWLIGGQAVELLCGGAVRAHDDIDFLVRAGDAGRALQVLQDLGLTQVHGSLEAGNVFYRRADLLVDVVPVLEQPPRCVGDLAGLTLPTAFLTDTPVVRDGVSVNTLTPDMHAALKGVVSAFYGAPMREKDLVDLAALRRCGFDG